MERRHSRHPGWREPFSSGLSELDCSAVRKCLASAITLRALHSNGIRTGAGNCSLSRGIFPFRSGGIVCSCCSGRSGSQPHLSNGSGGHGRTSRTAWYSKSPRARSLPRRSNRDRFPAGHDEIYLELARRSDQAPIVRVSASAMRSAWDSIVVWSRPSMSKRIFGSVPE
jgi:hypothetical protein